MTTIYNKMVKETLLVSGQRPERTECMIHVDYLKGKKYP